MLHCYHGAVEHAAGTHGPSVLSSRTGRVDQKDDVPNSLYSFKVSSFDILHHKSKNNWFVEESKRDECIKPALRVHSMTANMSFHILPHDLFTQITFSWLLMHVANYLSCLFGLLHPNNACRLHNSLTGCVWVCHPQPLSPLPSTHSIIFSFVPVAWLPAKLKWAS